MSGSFLNKKYTHIISGFLIGLVSMFIVWRLSKPALIYFCRYMLETEQSDMGERQAVPVDAITIKPETVYKQIQSIGTIKASHYVLLKSSIQGTATIMELLFTEGEMVEEGQELIKFDDKEARGRYEHALGDFKQAEIEEQTMAKLAASGAKPKLEYDKAKHKFESAKGRFDEAKALLEKTVIKAPFSGIIGVPKDITIGSTVRQDASLVSLVDDKKVRLEVSFPAKYADQISAGQTVKIRIDAYPEVEFEGLTTAVDNVVENETLLVVAEIDNEKSLLKYGMKGEVQLVTGVTVNAFTVPESALVRRGEVDYVFTAQKGKAIMTQIIKGHTVGSKRVVEPGTGLKDGDVVVKVATLNLYEGAPVRLKTLDDKTEDEINAAKAEEAKKAEEEKIAAKAKATVEAKAETKAETETKK